MSPVTPVQPCKSYQVRLELEPEYFRYLSAQSQCRSVNFSLKYRNLIGLAVAYRVHCLRAMVSNPTDKPNASPWRIHTSSVLTALTHISAPFITTFLLIHLAAPAAANLGGSALSSQTMVRFFLFYSCANAHLPVDPTASCLGASTTKLHLENGTSYSGRCSYTRPARSSIECSLRVYHAHSLTRSP